MNDLTPLEDIVDSVCGCWWHSEAMMREIWAGLRAARTTYNRLGYRTDSDEYQALTMLIEIHQEFAKEWFSK